MANRRELRDRDLDAAGFIVTGLPTAANPSEAVRLDQMQAADAAVASAASSALATETAARIAGDTAVGAAAAAALATEITNRIAGDATTLLSAETFTTTAIAAQAFGTASSTTLQLIDASQLTEGAIRIVATYMAPWKLVDGTVNTRTTIPHRVLPAAGRTNWFWVRIVCDGDPFWQAQTVWYVDPAGTNSTPGDDEASGLSSSHPLKSIAEWRRRVQGAVFTTTGPTIHALSGSTNPDDGLFSGFSIKNNNINTWVKLVGAPILTGLSGTIGSYVPYSGNTRGQFTDTSIPVSWTASGAISGPSGSRWARKVGSGVRHYAPLLKDLGSKSVQFGHVVDWDETDVLTINSTETNFANGDAYEVVSFLAWPSLTVMTGSVLIKCLDIQGLTAPDSTATFSAALVVIFCLCGFPQNVSFNSGGAALNVFSAVFCAAAPSGVSVNFRQMFLTNCSAVNTIFQYSLAGYSNSTTSLILVSSTYQLFHSTVMGSLGNLRFFDCTTPLIAVRHMSQAKAVGTIVGSGNSGALVNADTGGLFYGASLITAVTSKALPYTVSGVDYATPIVDGGSGDGIYN